MSRWRWGPDTRKDDTITKLESLVKTLKIQIKQAHAQADRRVAKYDTKMGKLRSELSDTKATIAPLLKDNRRVLLLKAEVEAENEQLKAIISDWRKLEASDDD